MELLITRNPEADSSLPYLLRLPLGPGLVFKARDTWPRTGSLYCHPVHIETWPADAEITERVALRVCERRGAAIDIVADRARLARSQIVFTQSKGRQVVFWNSPTTRRQARPGVRIPTMRTGASPGLEIIVDSREKYPYRFTKMPAVTVVRQALVCGDYAVAVDGHIVASVERKSLADLVTSLTTGKLTYALADLGALPHAMVVVEDRYSAIFKLGHVRPTLVADTLAELQVRYPTVPLLFLETRPLAEGAVCRFLAAVWARSVSQADGPSDPAPGGGPTATPQTVRAWAQSQGLKIPPRGRIPKAIWEVWEQTHPTHR